MKNIQKKVAIIGGGASGMVCAIICARAGLDVVLFEQNNKCGKKILVSGNGACNITNTDVKESDFYTQNPSFIKEVLQHYSGKKLMAFLESLGLVLKTEANGRVFPYSKDAKTVQELFLFHLEKLGVKIVYETKITTLSSDHIINGVFYDVIVLANGSQAYEKLGGNGSGYTLAASLGHTIQTPYPALVQLVTYEKDLSVMQGVKLDANVGLYINAQLQQECRGDLLFTAYGVSGLSILDLSIEASQALEEGSYVEVEIDLLPSFSIQQLSAMLASKELCYGIALHSLLPKKVVTYLCSVEKIDKNATVNQKQLKALLYRAKHLRFGIEKTKGFSYAEVCGGGVDTTQIDPHTFSSKKQRGVYIIGEVVDVVGKRGGYNFFFAFSSALLAGYDIIAKNKK